MRVAVVGSRTSTMADVVAAIAAFTRDVGVVTHVVSGGARGADAYAAKYASAFSVPVTVHYADWDQYGKSAGYKRNVIVVRDCEYVLAVWDGESVGTQHTMNIASEHGVPVFCYRTKGSHASS